jgi:hypothetical protein
MLHQVHDAALCPPQQLDDLRVGEERRGWGVEGSMRGGRRRGRGLRCPHPLKCKTRTALCPGRPRLRYGYYPMRTSKSSRLMLLYLSSKGQLSENTGRGAAGAAMPEETSSADIPWRRTVALLDSNSIYDTCTDERGETIEIAADWTRNRRQRGKRMTRFVFWPLGVAWTQLYTSLDPQTRHCTILTRHVEGNVRLILNHYAATVPRCM